MHRRSLALRRQSGALKEFVPTRRPDGHEEYYSSLWELGGLSREALAKDWLPNAKSLATTSSS